MRLAAPPLASPRSVRAPNLLPHPLGCAPPAGKSMKPAWDSLAQQFATSDKVFIGDVDCTASGKELCERIGVEAHAKNVAFMRTLHVRSQARG